MIRLLVAIFWVWVAMGVGEAFADSTQSLKEDDDSHS
jgi:hypothetical protein